MTQEEKLARKRESWRKWRKRNIEKDRDRVRMSNRKRYGSLPIELRQRMKTKGRIK